MSVTIDIEENQDVRVTEEVIDANPPDGIAFAAEGVVTVTKSLLDDFAGASLQPVRVAFSVDGSRTVETDLEGAPSLRLDTVDIGVETPDTGDLSPGTDSIETATEAESDSTDAPPGAIAFTVEGAIRDVSATSCERIATGSPTLESITFAVGASARSDGGSDDAALEVTLLGYGIVVHRDGTIEVETGVGMPDLDLSR